MSPFKYKVIKIVNEIPAGKVMSYGQVALYAGAPRGARQVGWILNQLEGKLWLPWWRVVNNHGILSIKGCETYDRVLMKKLLVSEGVSINENYTFMIEEYRYLPTDEEIKNWSLLKGEQEEVNQII